MRTGPRVPTCPGYTGLTTLRNTLRRDVESGLGHVERRTAGFNLPETLKDVAGNNETTPHRDHLTNVRSSGQRRPPLVPPISVQPCNRSNPVGVPWNVGRPLLPSPTQAAPL